MRASWLLLRERHQPALLIQVELHRAPVRGGGQVPLAWRIDADGQDRNEAGAEVRAGLHLRHLSIRAKLVHIDGLLVDEPKQEEVRPLVVLDAADGAGIADERRLVAARAEHEQRYRCTSPFHEGSLPPEVALLQIGSTLPTVPQPCKRCLRASRGQLAARIAAMLGGRTPEKDREKPIVPGGP